MNAVWDSSLKSWIIYQEGSFKKYLLKISWAEGVQILLDGYSIQDCEVELQGRFITQTKLISPHPSKQLGDFLVKAFSLTEL
jgi:hypothetical protein